MVSAASQLVSLPSSPSPHSSAFCSSSLPDFISYSAFRLLLPSPRSLLRLHFSSFQAAEEQGRERGSFSWWQDASVPLCVTVTEISLTAWRAWSCETGLPVSLLLFCFVKLTSSAAHPFPWDRALPTSGLAPAAVIHGPGFSDLSLHLLEPCPVSQPFLEMLFSGSASQHTHSYGEV